MLVDSLPVFMNLIKTHALLCAFLTSGDVDAALLRYDGHCYRVSEHSIVLKDFQLGSLEGFEYVQLTRMDSTTFMMLFVPSSSIYYESKDYYFGGKTIYYNILQLIKEKGIEIPDPDKYCFDFLNEKAAIRILQQKLISITYGKDICENY